jgi:hypothetical protein
LRKERRKERKENKRKIHGANDKVKKLDDKKYFPLEKNSANPEGGYPGKGIRDEAEQVEKSDVTEEHDQATCFESSRYLSDSTQSSDKRKRPLSSSNDNETQSGNQTQRPVIRIQLSFRKHKEPDAGRPRSSQEDVTRRAESLAQERTVLGHVPIENQFFGSNEEIATESEKLAPKSGKESISAVERMKICSQAITPDGTSSCENMTTSAVERMEICSQTRTAEGTNACENKIQGAESPHTTLIENWVPSQFELCQSEIDDEEWLFGAQRKWRDGSKRHKTADDVSCCRSSTLRHQAYLLPEADIYALPFTVPF